MCNNSIPRLYNAVVQMQKSFFINEVDVLIIEPPGDHMTGQAVTGWMVAF